MSTVLNDQLGDETEVEEAARQLRSAAEVAQLGGNEIEQTVAETAWAGPMKDRFVESTKAQKSELVGDAMELLDVASRLDRHAQWIRDEKARLDGLAARVDAWASANPAGSSETGQDAGLIAGFPPRHNFGWDELADRLRSQGIAF